jgi:hypothetical protein
MTPLHRVIDIGNMPAIRVASTRKRLNETKFERKTGLAPFRIGLTAGH